MIKQIQWGVERSVHKIPPDEKTFIHELTVDPKAIRDQQKLDQKRRTVRVRPSVLP